MAPGASQVTRDVELLSLDEFEQQLGELVEVSAQNGIGFDRSWTFRGQEEDVPDVMVEITRLQKRGGDAEKR
ncbi:hypothetical protein [Haladaptatus cibarius]|uniref:hypothetical protein n=1 Tax=Haladaptatus cibarius TaxID=453847 RepID=UPI0006798DA7|nr:hypothetical protein [Haladaptatus cibarius]